MNQDQGIQPDDQSGLVFLSHKKQKTKTKKKILMRRQFSGTHRLQTKGPSRQSAALPSRLQTCLRCRTLVKMLLPCCLISCSTLPCNLIFCPTLCSIFLSHCAALYCWTVLCSAIWYVLYHIAQHCCITCSFRFVQFFDRLRDTKFLLNAMSFPWFDHQLR